MPRLLFFILAGYLLTLTTIYLIQRWLQYHPNKSPPGAPDTYNVPYMREIRVKTSDGLENIAWFSPPREKDGDIVVICHGNAGHIGHRALKVPYFIERGFGVMLCEYRGFGGNRGSPTEHGLYNDARACLKWLDTEGYDAEQIVLYGESIGTGVAVQVALELNAKTLILEAPFSSAADIAKHRYSWVPVDYLMKDRYDNIDKIGRIKGNVLFIHGDEDDVVPIDFGKKLFDAANHPKEFITINGGGHSDLYEHHAGHLIADWLLERSKAAA